MNLFRPTSEISATPMEVSAQRTSEILGEAILASSSRVRDSLPEQHRAHFETLRQEIIDFAKAHGIPRDTLAKPDALREAASKLSTPDLKRLADLLERFEYLLVHHEPKKEDYTEALEHAERLYHLKEQYDSQVSLLKEVGILKEGAITGIDGKMYPIPTFEQIAVRLFERRETLETKHDQGFTKLLLVPFGMSLEALLEVLKQFLLATKKANPKELFGLLPNCVAEDIGDSSKLVYYPQSFDEDDHQGETKMEILKTNYKLPTLTPTTTLTPTQTSFPGWTIHLFQPSDPENQNSSGFALIPRRGEGKIYGEEKIRYDIEAGRSAPYYLSLLQDDQNDQGSQYFEETGMTPEDWIMAFMTHLKETGKPMDNWLSDKESISCLMGSFFPADIKVPLAFWMRIGLRAVMSSEVLYEQNTHTGIRTSVII